MLSEPPTIVPFMTMDRPVTVDLLIIVTVDLLIIVTDLLPFITMGSIDGPVTVDLDCS